MAWGSWTTRLLSRGTAVALVLGFALAGFVSMEVREGEGRGGTMSEYMTRNSPGLLGDCVLPRMRIKELSPSPWFPRIFLFSPLIFCQGISS
jgi:hypothetical protein